MNNNNPNPQPFTSAQAKENDKKRNQDQESNPKSSKKPKNDEIDLASISPDLVVVADEGSETGDKFSFLFELDCYVKLFGKFASEEELKLLRSLSKGYYQKLNPIYWDEAGLLMFLYDSNQLVIKQNDVEYQIYLEEEPYRNLASELEPIAHTFRHLILNDIHFPDLKWTELITLIRPHIKYLELYWIDEEPVGTTAQVILFMEQFNNLKRCKIEYTNNLTLDYLEMLLRRSSQSILFEIHFDTDESVQPILNQLGDVRNVCWNVETGGDVMFEEMRTIYAPLFRQWPNLDLNLDISTPISNLDDLRTTVQICLDYQNKINNLSLQLNFMDVPDQDEETVKASLGVLRSFVTELDLHFETKGWNIDIGNETWSWPKLAYLSLLVSFDTTGGNLPFVIMKNSPNLEEVYMDGIGDPRSIIIFQSQENVHEYFGGLTKLKLIRINDMEYDGFGENMQLIQAYLDQLLPEVEIQLS